MGNIEHIARIGLGAAVWFCAVAGLGTATFVTPLPWARTLAGYFVTPQGRVEFRLPHAAVKPRTPIYQRSDDGSWAMVGYVDGNSSSRDTGTVSKQGTLYSARWFAPQPIEQSQLEYFEANNSLGMVLRTLMSSEKQAWVRERLERLFREHRQEMLSALRPVFEKSLRESLPVVEDHFKASVDRHREELDRIAERYKAEIVKQRLVPLVREEVFPTVREHAEPVVRDIGRELWDRASVWRFGWRYLYDKSPLPDRKLVKEEWERFVRNEAIPLLNSRTEELLEVQRRIFADLAANPRLREELKEIGQHVLRDEELQELIGVILKETVLENQELRDVWLRNWQTPEAKAAVELVGERLEPVIREIGDVVFGTRERGISPEFARVLRNQILGKDRAWLVATPGVTLPVSSGTRQVPWGDFQKSEVPLLIVNAE